MPINVFGYQAFTNTIQQLKNEIKLAGRDDSAGKATLSSIPPEMQATIFENLSDSRSQRDEASFIAALPNFTNYFAEIYPTKEPNLSEVVNDLLFLFSPSIPSTASLSLVGRIVKYRPIITAALKKLTVGERKSNACDIMRYLFRSCSLDALHVMKRVYNVLKYRQVDELLHAPLKERQVFNNRETDEFSFFLHAIVQIRSSINTQGDSLKEQKDSSYLRHILVLILLSFLSFFPKESLNEKMQRQIGAITSLNLSPHFPFLLLTKYNSDACKPLPIYTVIFNAELRAFFLSNRSSYIMSPVRPILAKQKFSDINLAGRNLAYVTFFKVKFFNVSFANANLIRASFIDCKFSKVIFEGANLTGADLSKADLTGANLTEAILREANLHKAILSGADLTGANLTKAILREANLHKAILSRAILIKAELREANLSEVNLTEANLTGADLYSVDLSSTDLRGANFRQTNLYRANLNNSLQADYSFAPTDFRGACFLPYRTFRVAAKRLQDNLSFMR